MVTIVIDRFEDSEQFIARGPGSEIPCGIGETFQKALGNLIEHHAESLGITLRVMPKAARLRGDKIIKKVAVVKMPGEKRDTARNLAKRVREKVKELGAVILTDNDGEMEIQAPDGYRWSLEQTVYALAAFHNFGCPADAYRWLLDVLECGLEPLRE